MVVLAATPVILGKRSLYPLPPVILIVVLETLKFVGEIVMVLPVPEPLLLTSIPIVALPKPPKLLAPAKVTSSLRAQLQCRASVQNERLIE